MNTTHSVSVVIGRFQPVHRSHLQEVLIPALTGSDELIILLGSSQRPRTPKDPWTDLDRAEMIARGFADSGYTVRRVSDFHFICGNKRVFISPIKDSIYSNAAWQMNVQEAVRDSVSLIREAISADTSVDIYLYGVDRDESTFYLNMFPQWKSRTLTRDGSQDTVNGTMCRQLIFSGLSDQWVPLVTPGVAAFIRDWMATDHYKSIKAEFDFLKFYREEISKFKYPVIFQTADNIILWKGHVLLCNRKAFPGKGLWALPGGFVDQNETILKSAIDNAREKTRIDLKPEWLLTSRTFDNPKRSLRGRTITTVHLWKLPDHYSFDVEPGKNTSKVKWVPFCDVATLSSQLFEDHYDIIMDMLSSVR